jgi:nucleotide-binding universal stress UspA family protein
MRQYIVVIFLWHGCGELQMGSALRVKRSRGGSPDLEKDPRMSTQHPTDDPARPMIAAQPPAEPLSPLESRLAEAEALQRAPQTSGAAGESRRRGRIEAETRRISDEITRQAQQRRTTEQRRQAQLAIPPDALPEAIRGAATPPPADTTPTSSGPAPAEPLVWDFASSRLPESLAFKRILVPLDGSERAERAIPLAAHIAQASRGSVLLVRVVSPQVVSGMGFAPVEEGLEAALAAADTYLKQVERRDELVDVEAHRKALTGVSAATTLLEAITLYQCDLVVICSHGRSGLTRWALGSVAQKIVRHAAAPVLVLRPEGPLPPTTRPGSEPAIRALVTLDGSALAETALLPAARLVAALASPGHGALHLLRVLDRSYADAGKAPTLPYRDADEAAREEARTYLHSVTQRFQQGELAALGLRISWSMRDDMDVAYSILDEAEGDEAGDPTRTGRFDLIAMATHGRSGLRLMALGSITDRVLQTTRLPLLVVPPRPEES